MELSALTRMRPPYNEMLKPAVDSGIPVFDSADDFYFSDEKEAGKIGLYHNTSGIFDAAKAEELDVSDSEFFKKMDDYENRCQLLSWTSVGRNS